MRIPGLLETLALHESARGVTGKTLAERVAYFTQGHWKPSFGSIYPLFSRLQQEGLVRAELIGQGRRSIAYHLTQKGRRALAQRKAELMVESRTGFWVVRPIVLRVAYGFDEEEMAAATEAFKEIMAFHERVLALPGEKRKEAMRKMMHACGKK
ncbi:PadR family transcriptional regulator [Candidatus Micrarchaeota archaeon]|nr:PadR family transcriptional regulator [Candidatus Micrarchaeota archaeon]